MSDSAALRSILTSIDMSAPAIHRAAGAMMKHYDKSAGVAVTEWRNALQTVQTPQMLPLWYVVNEVLQNSKRNRGNKFLEAFSPILGQSMSFMCSRSDAATVEKVRRTAKIWGDRQVYSTRYVGDLLSGVEQYRHKDNSQTSGSQEEVNFSPEEEKDEKSETAPTPVLKEDQPVATTTSTRSANRDADASSDDDSLGFGGIGKSSGRSSEGLGHLDIDLTIDTVSSGLDGANKRPPNKKRRLGSGGGTTRRKSVLSTMSLMELWTQVQSLQQRLENSHSIVQMVRTSLDTQGDVDQLVGEELLDQFRSVVENLESVEKSRRVLHGIASDRHAMEQEATRYLPWLQRALLQDDEDVAFCRDLSKKLLELKVVHGAANEARERKRQAEAERRSKEEREAKKRREEEERKRMLDAALKTEHEAKPGQVWNKATGEYVYLNTDESWRD